MTKRTFPSDRLGPTVVVLGGGHGVAATLRAARLYAGSVTAVVSVADDGGSSGRLRAATPDLPAPGDVRRCLVALADDHSALAQILEHRYGDGDGALAGHALGNLLLATLTDELGSFEAAVDEVARLVGAVGRVLPATTVPVTLVGEAVTVETDGDDEAVVEVVGQVAVQNSPGISRVTISPADAPSSDAVRSAILGADQVVLGPGSLFTSVLAAAVVPAVAEALAETTAQRVFVANLRPQVPETEGFLLSDYLEVLGAHGVPVDVVICQAGQCEDLPEMGPNPMVVERVLIDEATGGHHPERLAAALAGLLRSSAFPGVR